MSEIRLIPYAVEVAQAMQRQNGGWWMDYLPEVVRFLTNEYREVKWKVPP